MSNKRQFIPQQNSPSLTKTTTVVQHAVAMQLSGPLPPPEILGGYEQVVPGSAQRILSMAELNQTHRHAMEAQEQRNHAHQISAGQVFAFILGAIGLTGGLILAWNGKSFVGLTAFIGTMVMLVGAYLYGRKSTQA